MQWTPGDYTSKLNTGLLSSAGPDVFESQLNIDQVKSGQIVALDDIIGGRQERLHRRRHQVLDR